jgi:ferrous iron transport protein A
MHNPSSDLSLAHGDTGGRYRVTAIVGGERLSLRLRDLGLAPGTLLCKVSGQLFRGPVVVRFQGTELALGHRTACKVMVEPAGLCKP